MTNHTMSMQRPIIRNIETAVRKAGLEMPEAIRIAVAEAESLRRNRGPKAKSDELVDAVARAYVAGRDPGTDKAVRAALDAHTLATAAQWDVALDNWAVRHINDAFEQHHDGLLEQWADAVTAAGSKLAAAVPHLDKTLSLPAQAERALKGGGAIAEAWRDAVDAATVVDALVNAQALLITQFHRHAIHGPVLAALLRSHEMPTETLDTVIAKRQSGDTWKLASEHGVRIIGATLDDITRAEQRIAEDRQKAQTAYEEEARKSRGAALRFR